MSLAFGECGVTGVKPPFAAAAAPAATSASDGERADDDEQAAHGRRHSMKRWPSARV